MKKEIMDNLKEFDEEHNVLQIILIGEDGAIRNLYLTEEDDR